MERVGEVALITGGAKRIGKEIALSLGSMGYNIALHYHSSEPDAMRTAEELRSLGVRCEIYKCDLSKQDEVLSLIPQVTEHLTGISLLINNASVFERGTLIETGPELFDKEFAINLKAPYFLSREFARICKKGQIINIVDSRVYHNDFIHSAYLLSKKGLLEFTKSSARELAPEIRVNAVAPGIILPSPARTEEYKGRRVKDIPMKRMGSVSCITEAVRFLIKNDFITGQLLFLDGGENL